MIDNFMKSFSYIFSTLTYRITLLIQQYQLTQQRAMTSIQKLHSYLTLSDLCSPHKIDSSLGTEATSCDLFKKKVGLCCSSSISLEQMLESSDSKECFARYLLAFGSKNEQESFEDLRLSYEQIVMQGQKQEEMIVDLRNNQKDFKGEVLSYFLSVWLRHMGYGTQKNKKHLHNRVKLFLGANFLYSFTKLYKNLNLLCMPQSQKQIFLINTCRYGWQYFIQDIVRRNLLSQYSNSSNKKSGEIFQE